MLPLQHDDQMKRLGNKIATWGGTVRRKNALRFSCPNGGRYHRGDSCRVARSGVLL